MFARWIEELQSYDFSIKFKDGKYHCLPDYLSRPQECWMTTVTQHPDITLLDSIKRAASLDEKYQYIRQALLDGKSISHYSLQEDLLHYAGKLYVPHDNNLRTFLLAEYHDLYAAGHLGARRMGLLLQQGWWWPDMQADVKDYVKSCPSCQLSKPSHTIPYGTLLPHNIPNKRWEEIGLDASGELPMSPYGHNCFLIIQDRLSRSLYLIPTKTTDSAHELARLGYERVFSRHGLPKKIISDRAKLWTCQFWQSLWRLARQGVPTKLNIASPFHPETDGGTERSIQTIKHMLTHFCEAYPSHWEDVYPACVSAYMAMVQESTGFSAAMLDLGYQPEMPAQLAAGVHSHPEVNHQAVDFLTQWNEALDKAKASIRHAQELMVRQYGEHHRDVSFQLGDLVKVNLKATRFRANPAGLPTFANQWAGPFKVVAQKTPVTYLIDLPPGSTTSPLVHVSQIERFYPRDITRFPHAPTAHRPSPLRQVGDQEVYEIRNIVKHNFVAGRPPVSGLIPIIWEVALIDFTSFQRPSLTSEQLLQWTTPAQAQALIEAYVTPFRSASRLSKSRQRLLAILQHNPQRILPTWTVT